MSDAVKEAIERAITHASKLSGIFVSEFGLVELGRTLSLLVDALSDADRCDLLERPARSIIADVQYVLNKADNLVFHSKMINPVRCLFARIPKAAFEDIRSMLETSAGNVRWLLAISTVNDDIDFLGLPPILLNDPKLCLIWSEVGKLLKGPMRIKADAAALLGSYAHEHDHVRRQIIEEGGVVPLLRVLEEGFQDGQVNAAAALVALAKDRESVDAILKSGACAVFIKVLKTGPMRAKAAVASAIADFADKYPSSQNVFAQPHNNVVRLLVANLVSLQVGNADNVSRDEQDEMTAMAAEALWKLARGNPTLCRSIIVSGALRCISDLIENGPHLAQYCSTMAFMEISRVTEREADLRRLAFKAGDSAARDVVEQMISIVKRREYPELVHPCVVTLGCLRKTFEVNQTHMIGPLLGLLESDEPELVHESAAVLVKFTANGEKQMQNSFMDAVIREGGIHPTVLLVLFAMDRKIRSLALELLCRLALYEPDNGELANLDVLAALRVATSNGYTARDARGMDMIPVAKAKLEAYRSRTRI